MIIKSYEIEKIDFKKIKILLLYGKNDGFKKEFSDSLLDKIHETLIYDQNEILEKQDIFFENIYSSSLFDNTRNIIIKRVTDKFLNIIEKIDFNKIKDLKIILNADALEKKSKLRSKFEKDKNLVCVAFYPDNNQTLSKLAYQYLKKNNISLSSSNVNFIIDKCKGDREVFKKELEKIILYCRNGKKITEESLAKLINLNENHNISELVDSYLLKNNKKIIKILNENNFNNEDCILITRTFLNKSKKLLILSHEYNRNNNMELTISNAKPPIFWKEKDITIQQIYKWKPQNIKKLIYKLNEIELIIKKNITISISVISDFIFDENFWQFSN